MRNAIAKDLRRAANAAVVSAVAPQAEASAQIAQAITVHNEILLEHSEKLRKFATVINAHGEVFERGFWGRLRWLVSGR